MGIVTIPNWGLGLNTDANPMDLPLGFCTSATNMRFYNNYAQRVGGLTDSGLSITGNPVWTGQYTRSAGSISTFTLYASLTNVYTYNGGALLDLTRYTDGAEIASITFVGTTATVTTKTAHGRTTGDAVSVYAALPVEYNATGAITVTGATTFTYVMASAPATNATYTGAYSYNVVSAFTGTTLWTTGTLNGIFFINHPTDGIYYWNGDTSLKLRKFPQSGVADSARAFKNYIIQTTPRASNWSSAAPAGAIPLYWTASIATGNDSGFAPVAATDGVLVDSLTYGNAHILYAQDTYYAMEYVGGNQVFTVRRIPGNDGVLKVNCVVDTPKGHVFLSQNSDVKIHNGGAAVSLAEGRVRSSITNLGPIVVNGYVWLGINPKFNEVWVCYPTASASSPFYPDKALMWNWKDDTWGTKTLPNVTFGGSYGGSMVVCAANPSKLGTQDASGAYQDFGSPYASTITRSGLNLGDSEAVKDLSRSRWHFDNASAASVPTITISHSSAMTSNGTVTSPVTGTYTYGTTNWVDARAPGGRFLTISGSITPTAASAQNIRFKTVDLDVVIAGKK